MLQQQETRRTMQKQNRWMRTPTPKMYVVESIPGTNIPQEPPADAHVGQTLSPTPLGDQIDGTQTAAKVVKEVASTVKAAVGGAITWAEKKVDALTADADSTGYVAGYDLHVRTTD